MTQKEADERMESALRARDLRALAQECARRMRALPPGGSLSFRIGEHYPIAWRMPLWNRVEEPPWDEWGDIAATALLHSAARHWDKVPA